MKQVAASTIGDIPALPMARCGFVQVLEDIKIAFREPMTAAGNGYT
jgi:hypothetical protein